MNTVIYIDAFNHRITRVPLPDGENTLDFLQGLVGGYIEVVSIMRGEDLIVDEEGLLKGPQHFFIFKGVGQEVYAGNGVIAGTNRDGETVGTVLTVEAIKERVKFTNRQGALLYSQKQGR